MLGYFPEPYFNSCGVRRILSTDWISRRELCWPLVPFDQILPLFSTNMTWLDPPQQLQDLPSTAPSSQRSLDAPALLRQLHSQFPPLDILLRKHHGKVAVCGGSLCRLACEELSPGDCDIFFYGTDELITPEGLNEYRNILEDCVAIIASSYPGERVWVDRSENVVTVSVKGREYQFILRIYARIDMIIGGFDLGPSMIAFDGVNLWATQLGAWSLAKGAIIVDTTRRSTSYEYRLEKYSSFGFGIVLPGLDISQCCDMTGGDAPTLNGCFRIRVGDRIPMEVGLQRLRKRYTKDMKMVPRSVIKISDYGPVKPATWFCLLDSYHDGSKELVMSKFYTTLLKIGQREKFFVCSTLPNHYVKAREEFATLIDHPHIPFCDNYLEIHNQQLQSIPAVWRLNISRRDARIYAEYFVEFQELMSSFCQGRGNNRRMLDERKIRKSQRYINFMAKITPVLNNRIVERAREWIEDFKGLKWRTKNPGTQHTSSINPIMEDPRKFYQNCYRPFTVGITQDVEHCIWVLFCGQLKFPVEVVKLITRYLVLNTNLFFYSTKCNQVRRSGVLSLMKNSKKRKLEIDYSTVLEIKKLNGIDRFLMNVIHDEEAFSSLASFVLLRKEDKVLSLEESIQYGLQDKYDKLFYDSNVPFAEDLWLRYNPYHLTKEEVFSIYYYTLAWAKKSSNIYTCLNRDLFSKNHQVATKWRFYLHYFFSAMRKLPTFNGTLYSAAKANICQEFPQKYVRGNSIIWNTITSATTCLDRLLASLKDGEEYTVFTLSCSSGRSISRYSEFPKDEETIVLPGTRFKISSIEPMESNITNIQIKQIPTLDKMLLL